MSTASAFGFISFLGLIYALPRLNLADVTALTFTAPLWSLMLSVLFLGDRIRPSRWLATAIGFGGVLLVAKPDGHLEPAMLAALLAALFSSLAMMKVKQLSATEPPRPDRLLFPAQRPAARPAAGAAGLADARSASDAAAGGDRRGLVHRPSLSVARLRAGQFSKMAPMDFFRLPLAILLGFAVFAELPDLLALVGMAIIVAASLYILLARSGKSARV
ncbi:MAG: DMT family transporter [Pseudomonadota bacterium]